MNPKKSVVSMIIIEIIQFHKVALTDHLDTTE